MISVLYVDDDTDLLYLCKSFLELDLDFSVDTCESASEALDKVFSRHYDAIISDYQMPGMNAIDFLKRIRSTVGNIPFILFTGKGREDVVIEALNFGADFYLQKGCDTRSQFVELSHMITRAIERRKAASDLQESVARLSHAEEIANMGHWEVNLDTRRISGSSGTMKIYGLDQTEYPLDEVQAMVLPPFRPLLDKALDSLIRERVPYDIEFKIFRKNDGTIIDIHSVAEFDPIGNRVFGIIQDITRSKKAEEAFLNSKGHLQTLIQTIPDLIWLKDTNGKYLFCNTMFERFFGARESEIVGRTDYDFLSPTLADFFRNRDRIAMEAGRPTINEEWITFADDGHRAYLETIKTPMYDNNGKLIGVLGIGRDITERTKAEQELHEKSAFLENLISIANVPIIVWDPSFRITRVNRAFEDLTGWTIQEIVGKPLDVLFPPEQVERTIRLFQTTLAGVRWKTTEIEILHRDGTIRTLLWNSATLYSEDGRTPVATIAQGYDITGERRLKQEKDYALTQIQQNLAYLAVLNDEIRNPLTVILSYADMMDSDEPGGEIARQVARIDEMVNQLDIRWIESEKVLNAIRKHYQVHSAVDDGMSDSTPGIQSCPELSIDDSMPSSEPGLIEEIQAQLYSILDSIDALIYVSDMDTYDLLFINQIGRARFGDVIGQKCYTSLYNFNKPCSFCKNHLFATQDAPTDVYEWEYHDIVSEKWYNCRDRAIRWSDGRLVRLEIATDITRYKIAEEELRRSESILLEDHQIAGMGRWNYDLSSSVTTWSDGMYALLGIDPGGIRPVFDAYLNYIHPEDRDLVSCSYNGLLSDKKSYEIQYRLMSQDLKVRWIREISRIYHNNSAQPVSMVGILQDITGIKQAEGALRISEETTRRKLDSLLLPEGEIGLLCLTDILDIGEIQLLMDDFHSLTGILVAILDIQGNILVASGWQDICTKFHRINPETCKNCIESDTILSKGVLPGQYKLYRCKNNMLDIATPIVVGDTHLGNLFLGQFFFDDEEPDYTLFRRQAAKFGFDEDAYLAALDRVPRLSRHVVDTAMHFYTRLISLVARVSWNNIMLARTLHERDLLLTTVKESEEKFRNYINNAPDGIFIADEMGHFHEVNPKACEITGYSVGELLGMNIRDLIPPESIAAAEEHFSRVIHYGKTKGETLIRRKDGSIVFWSVNAVKISSNRFLGFFQDISERKLIEASLRASETRYRQLIEHAHDGIAVTQYEKLQLVNPRMEELTGYNESELLSLPFLTFIYPDDRDMVWERYQKRLSGEDVPSQYIYRLLRKDGSIIWVEMSAAIVPWSGESATLNFFSDITDRKNAEEAFRESEERYRTLAEHAPVGILTCSKSGTITYINPKLVEMLGSEDKEITKKINLLTFRPLVESGLSSILKKSLETGVPVSSFEFAYTSIWGKNLYYFGHISPLTHDGMVYGAQIILNDITRRKVDEEALRESNKKLRLLTSLTRHDIFNQLSAVELLHDMASHASDMDKVREYITLAKKAEEQIEETIGFTREYENFGDVSSTWLSVFPVIESAKTEVSLKNIRIDNLIPETLEVYTDPIIRKVFTTLLENAVRHGGEISRIRFSCEHADNLLIIICEDNGSGISLKEKNLVFEHGYGKNTGIGLFLAREILSITGLSIRETGEEGKGARFEILIPEGKFRQQIMPDVTG